MAKDNKKPETALAVKDTSQVGTFLPDDFGSFISGGGFARIETVMIGHPDDGKFPFYIGQLVGPGEPIEIEGDKAQTSTLPTWAFHPMVKMADGTIGAAENITHIVPAPYMINAACARIHGECTRNGKGAIVALSFEGKGKTRKGRPFNQYKVYEKYTAKPDA